MTLTAWEIAVCGALLMPPAIVLVNIVISTDKRVRIDEGICLLSIPLTIYHVCGLVRFLSKFPDVGPIPGIAIVGSVFCATCLLVLVQTCVKTSASRWSQTISRWFGIVYFTFLTAAHSVGWLFGRIL